MTHKFMIGQDVYYAGSFPHVGSRGTYKIVRLLPVEKDDRLRYRIKSEEETFDRVADENQLSGD